MKPIHAMIDEAFSDMKDEVRPYTVEELEMMARAKADVHENRFPCSKDHLYLKTYVEAQKANMIENAHNQIKEAL